MRMRIWFYSMEIIDCFDSWRRCEQWETQFFRSSTHTSKIKKNQRNKHFPLDCVRLVDWCCCCHDSHGECAVQMGTIEGKWSRVTMRARVLEVLARSKIRNDTLICSSIWLSFICVRELFNSTENVRGMARRDHVRCNIQLNTASAHTTHRTTQFSGVVFTSFYFGVNCFYAVSSNMWPQAAETLPLLQQCAQKEMATSQINFISVCVQWLHN